VTNGPWTEWHDGFADTIACPRCGEQTSNPMSQQEVVCNDDEYEGVECGHCAAVFDVLAEAQFRFRAVRLQQDDEPTGPIIEGARGLDAPGGTEP
jgi:hypothetical protein